MTRDQFIAAVGNKIRDIVKGNSEIDQSLLDQIDQALDLQALCDDGSIGTVEK